MSRSSRDYQKLFRASWALACLATCAPLASPQSTSLSIRPRGAFATGTQTTFRVGHAPPATGNEYHFKFVGNETLEYVVDTGDTDVQHGLIRVHELQSQSYPIYQGGLAWRTNSVIHNGSGYITPANLAAAQSAPLFHEFYDATAGKLTLKYRDVQGLVAKKIYEFQLVGKVLQVRAYEDPTQDADYNNNFLNNYGFLYVGPFQSSSLSGAPEQQIPFMDNVPLIRFGTTQAVRFCAAYPDWYATSGVALNISIGSGQVVSNTYERFYPLVTLQNELSQVLAQVDETLNVIVTSVVEDTFPVPSNYRSPYYALTAGRMTLFNGEQSPGTWTDSTREYGRFFDWGLSDLSILQYRGFLWQGLTMTPDNAGAGPMGCDMGDYAGIWNNGPTDASGTRLIDPHSHSAQSYVAAAWGTGSGTTGLVPAAHRCGALFAHTVVHDIADQWGIGTQGGSSNYPPSTVPGVPATNNYYPTSIGFYPVDPFTGAPEWFDGTSTYGLAFPSFTPGNTAYVDSRTVRDRQNNITQAWDSGLDFMSSSWWPSSHAPGYGFRYGNVDPGSLADHLKEQLRFGQSTYNPSAVLFDASGQLPLDFNIDQQSTSSHTHTTGDYLKKRAQADRDVRSFINGPMYGETNYWNYDAFYEYGARDGFRITIPNGDLLDPSGSTDMHDNWLIPDYMLREVMAKASGNSGPEEFQFWRNWSPQHGIPYDGRNPGNYDGDENTFIDQYATTLATYALNPFANTNGDTQFTYWTYQGMLRQYATLCPVAKTAAGGKVTSVTYYVGSATYSLEDAIAQQIDLKNPRVKIQYDNGLVVAANRATSGAWSMPVTRTDGTGDTLQIQPNGFAAWDGSQVFVFFNSIPAGYSAPLDYAKYVGRWEMLNDRRTDDPNNLTFTQYPPNGFPSTSSTNLFSHSDRNAYAEGLVMYSEMLNRLVGAAGGLWASNGMGGGNWVTGSTVSWVSLGAAPAPSGVSVSAGPSVTRIYTLKPEGFLARLNTSSGPWQDVSTLATWSATWTGTGTIVVNNGVVNIVPTASVPSGAQAIITATYNGFTGTLAMPVIEGKPTANAGSDVTVVAGAAAVLNASSSSDPKHGIVSCTWDFGDSTTGQGAIVSHVYTLASTTPYVATLTVTDVEGNTSQDTALVTVNWPNSYDWADTFDDGNTTGLSTQGTGLWGVTGGAVNEALASSGISQLTIKGHTWSLTSTGVEVNLLNATAAGKVGLAVRKTNETDAVTAGGYNTYLDQTGLLVFRKGSAIVSQVPLGSLDLSRRHDLRLVTVIDTSGNTSVRIYVDGQKRLTYSDSAPPNQGFTSVWTENIPALLDDLRVTSVRAPYVSASPMELVSTSASTVTFYMDDQDLFTDIDQANIALVIRAEDGPSAGASLSYSGLTAILATMNSTGLSYENGTAGTSTWASMTMSRTVEYFMNTTWPGTNTLSIELTVPDLGGHFGHKLVRYTR